MPAIKSTKTPVKSAKSPIFRPGDAKTALGKQVKVKSDKTKSADRMRAFMRKKSGKPEKEVIVKEAVEEDEEEMEIDDEVEGEGEGGGSGGEVEVQQKPVRKPSGKKGKKFVENPVDLLNLVNMITGVKDDAQKIKLSKVAKPPPPKIALQKKLDKSAAKVAQFESAKAVISAQTRAKKDRRISREEGKKGNTSNNSSVSGEAKESGGKKSVSWA